MRQRVSALFRRSRIVRTTAYAFATIVLGAVGSGLWERLLAPLVSGLSNHFLQTASWLFRGYADVLHARIGNADNNIYTHLPYAAVLSVVLVLPWSFIALLLGQLRHMEKRLEGRVAGDDASTQDWLRRSRRRVYRFLVPLALFTTVAYLNIAFSEQYSRRASLFVDRSIEMLAPTISPQQVLVLRASYRSVDDAKKFYDFYSTLIALAREHHVELPKFTPIR